MEKLHLIEQLDEEEKKSIFNIVDGLVSKKKLRDKRNPMLSQVNKIKNEKPKASRTLGVRLL